MTSKMPSGHLGRFLAYALLATRFFGGAEGSARAQEAPRYMTSEEDIEDLDVVNLKNRISAAVQFYSVLPMARPFQNVQGSEVADFNYQISGGFGAEFAYKLFTNFDLGLSLAYEVYESRIKLGTGLTEINDARMRIIPVVATARWQWPRQFWSPEAEVGLGMGFYSMSVESTNESRDSVTDAASSLLAHAAGGMSLAWLDDTNIGVLVGYRQMLLSSQDFSSNANIDIRRNSLSGIFAKASLRHHF